VNLLVFVLGFFIDFFEIAFIVLPLLAPVADQMGIDLIWFGVILAMNLQTSFLTPPFGFSLFYLRSVAARKDYKTASRARPSRPSPRRRSTRARSPSSSCSMVVAVVMNPQLVSGIDADKALETMGLPEGAASDAEGAASAAEGDSTEEDDPMKALEESMKKDAQGKK
jgi:hypothetical protein